MRTARDLRSAVLDFMRSTAYRPATVRALARLLGVPRDRRSEFKRLLRDMLNEEEIVRVDHDRYALPRPLRPAGRAGGAGVPAAARGPAGG